MATLVFAAAGTALGGSLALGALGTAALATAGSIAGGYIDQAIFGIGDTSTQKTQVLQQPLALTSQYGQTIPLAYGMARVSGNVLWLSDPRTVTLTQTQNVRTGKFSSRSVTTAVDRQTMVDVAIAITAVPSLASSTVLDDEDGSTRLRTRPALIGIRRIWADAALIFDARTSNLSAQLTNNYTLAGVYDGSETQLPSSLIEEVAGVGNVPAFRGLAYILLQDLRISDYGNRIPNVQVEVVASLAQAYTEQHPEGLAQGLNGDIYAISHLQRTITRFNAETLQGKQVIGRNDPNAYLGTLKAHPWRLAVSPVDGHLWVTCQGDAAVQRIHPETGAVLATIATAHYPQDIAIGTDGVPWVTFPTSNRVARLSPTANTVSAYYEVAGAPWAVCLDGSNAPWFTTTQHVVRLNATTGLETARIAVGLFPWGITWNPLRDEIWVANSAEDYLSVISVASNTVIRQRNTGTYPTDVSIHPNDPHASVAVTLLYGNQLKVYSRTYAELLEYGMVAFPGPCLHLADGRVVIAQTRDAFLLIAEGR